ncbi:MAG: carbohydrate kinase family protein, partial [Actinomycetota bacterium]
MSRRAASVLVVGDLVADVRVAPGSPLEPGEEVEGDISLQGGGSSANQAVWLARAGAAVRFVGRVGDDLPGAVLVDELAREGVEVHVPRDPEHPTGMVAAIVEAGGERSLVTSRGANAHLQAQDVPPSFWGDAALLSLTGYLFTEPSSSACGRKLIDEARARELPFVLDPASARLLRRFPGRERFLEWTAGARWFLPNSSEGRVLSGASTDEDAARALLELHEGVVVTRGRSGCMVATRDDPLPRAVPVERSIAPVDATGAGDAFAAGFLHSWLSGSDPPEAARAGHALAATSVP